MSQPSLPFEIEWLNDNERHHAALLLTGLTKLCKARDHPLTVLTIERIKHIILTDAQASRLEARLVSLLNRPGERIPGAFINAVTTARDRHARAIEAFEIAYPAPAAGQPEGSEDAKTGKTTHSTERPGDRMEHVPPIPDPPVPTSRQEHFAQWDEIHRRHPEAKAEAANASTNPKPQQENTLRTPASSGTAPALGRQSIQPPQPSRAPAPPQPEATCEETKSPTAQKEIMALAG